MIENLKDCVIQNFGSVPDSFLTGDHFNGYKMELRNCFRIFSISERCDSILMWSHYADSHKGFCIGFRDNLSLSDNFVKKVVYREARNPTFLFNRLLKILREPHKESVDEELIKEFYLTKFIDWSYEKEWRILISLPKNAVPFPAACIDRIIFGLKMPREDRLAIREILKDRNINYFEAIKSTKDFAIEMRPVSE